MQLLKKSFFVFLIANFSLSALAQEACIPNLVSLLDQQADRQAFIRGKVARLEPQAQRAFTGLEALLARGEFNQLLPENLVLDVIADEEMLLYVRNLDWLLGRLNDRGTLPADTREALAQAARELLSGSDLKVPPSTVEARIAQFLQAPDARSMRRLLGDMELDEIQLLVHGGNPLNPSADSLLGRYIQETGAATLVRSFSQDATPNGPQGPQRLVLAMSAESMPVYKKYFDRPEFLIHAHAPGQGTLQFAHNGRVGTYANNQSYADPLNTLANSATPPGNATRLPSTGSVWPHIVLKSTEGQRATQVFRLGSSQHGTLAQRPWEMNNGYCAAGGYTSCTHWIGNLPLGDRQVTEYTFPGYVDTYAGNTQWAGRPGEVMGNIEGRTQELRAYDANAIATSYQGIDSEKFRALVSRVWKAPAGNQQLADLLGLRANNLRGEFASPGYVGVTLTGAAPAERVPFVFLSTVDHRQPIPVDFPTQMRAY
jgi:hypothetical protein